MIEATTLVGVTGNHQREIVIVWQADRPKTPELTGSLVSTT